MSSNIKLPLHWNVLDAKALGKEGGIAALTFVQPQVALRALQVEKKPQKTSCKHGKIKDVLL